MLNQLLTQRRWMHPAALRIEQSAAGQGNTGAGAAAGTAESRWVIPRNAPLGQWEVSLRKGDKRYDGGSKEGFLEATVELALQHPQVGESFRAYLKALAL